MSRYAVYKFFGSSSAPNNIDSCGYLAGVLVGTSDDNPLYRRKNKPDARTSWVDNEFSPHINVNVRPQAEED
jgi:hypothetical protein